MAFDKNVPLAANQISADIVAVNANWEYVISGDGTAGRVLRVSQLVIDNGTNASTLKCTLVSKWNGDAISVVDNIAKGATTGTYWTLDADGKILTIEASGLSGNMVAVLSTRVHSNLTTTNLTIEATVLSNDIILCVQDADVGTNIDMTGIVDIGLFYVELTYITDA